MSTSSNLLLEEIRNCSLNKPYEQPAILGQTVFLQKRPDKVQTMTLAELNSMYQITGLPIAVKAVWRVAAKAHYGLFRREHSTGLALPWPITCILGGS